MSDPNLLTQRQIQELQDGHERLRKADVPGVAMTYTPTYTGLSTAGVTTYTTQIGYFMQIGKMVIVSVFLNWSAATGTGIALVSLPFAPSYASSIRYAGGASKGGNVRTAIAETGAGAQACYLTTGGAAENVSGTGDITLTLMYFT